MTLPTNMVTNVLSENQNKFITVKFLTKDNEERNKRSQGQREGSYSG